MEVFEPVQGVGDQEVTHLAAAEVEDVGAPVGVLAAQRVRILVQRGAIEAGQREVVLREVGGNPVEDDADARAVEGVHEVAEVIRGAVARGGGVVGGHLITPRATEGVLGERHELHVREAHLLDVGDQLVGQLTVAQALAPRARVDLVNRHGAGVDVAVLAGGHPLLVGPLVEVVGDDRGGGRGDLGGAGQRVGLLEPVAAGALDLELVARTHADLGNEELPHAGRTQRTHGGLRAVPVVEFADDAHGAGVGGPHGKGGTGGLAELVGVGLHVRAQDVPEVLVATLRNQVGVHLAQGRQVPVGIIAHDGVVAVGDGHAVGGDLLIGQGSDPDAAALVGSSVGARRRDDVDRVGQVRDDADGDAVVAKVGAQHGVGRVVGA